MNFFFWRHNEMLPLPYQREVHCHVLPGLDDGSGSMSETGDCLKLMAQMGVRHVVCTPHHNLRYPNTLQMAKPVFDEVRANYPMLESLSFEYRIDPSIDQLDGFVPIAGRYVLIEDGFRVHYDCLEQVAKRVFSMGYVPVLAHPERYEFLSMRGIDYCSELRGMGLLFQCNMLSFAGYYGSGPKDFVFQMFDRGFIDFMGSDMHNTRYAHALAAYLKTDEYSDIRESFEAMIMNDQI